MLNRSTERTFQTETTTCSLHGSTTLSRLIWVHALPTNASTVTIPIATGTLPVLPLRRYHVLRPLSLLPEPVPEQVKILALSPQTHQPSSSSIATTPPECPSSTVTKRTRMSCVNPF